MKLSQFGTRFGTHTGILSLMDDLGKAMSGSNKVYMLGGGNPAAIPEVQAVWRKRTQDLLTAKKPFDDMLCNYDTPQGRPAFIEAIVNFFRSQYGWNITKKNVAITNGSQNAFFYLFNMIAGEYEGNAHKKILLPIAPEYIGYADQGVSPDIFCSQEPKIELIDIHKFKYHIDFDALKIDSSVAAIALSRPTNPSGNVVTDTELSQLSKLAKKNGIYLIIDNAYGAPFPGILFADANPIWDEHIIVTLSLSKLGLPGARTGIVIASEEIAAAVTAINAVIGLACTNVGQELVTPFLQDGSILELCKNFVLPFYQSRRKFAEECIDEFFDANLPYRFHRCEGALFFWLWLKDLPISSQELYTSLKDKGVVVVPGQYFFFGLNKSWQHQNECLRINFTQPEDTVRQGLKIIGEEISRIYHSQNNQRL